MNSTTHTSHRDSAPSVPPNNWRDDCSLLASFQSHWLQCVEAMRSHSPEKFNPSGLKQKQEISLTSLWQNWEYLEQHLILVDQVGASQNSTAEELERGLWNCIIWNQVLEHFLDWAVAHIEAATISTSDNVSINRSQHSAEYLLDCGVKALWHLLGFCEKLLTQTRLVRDTFLMQEIHCPLLRLPRCCQLVPTSCYSRLHKRLVFYLYHLCICMASLRRSLPVTNYSSCNYVERRDVYPLLDVALQLLRSSSSTANESSSTDQIILTKNYFLAPLIAGLHDDDADLAYWSREALMLLLNLTPRVHSLTIFIAKESDLCPVLATGLSALYSELPRELPLYEWPEDWCQLQPKEWTKFPTLMNFLTSLEFCNYAIKVSHSEISQQILDLTYSGFLISVVAPALHQTSLQEVIACTAYLELILRRLREPRFLAVFLRFILTEQFDGTPILTTLIRRINTNSDLCLLTLSLFRTMLWLHSEDVMYWLIFRFCEAAETLTPSVYLQTPESMLFLRSCFHSAAKCYASLANSMAAFNQPIDPKKAKKVSTSKRSPFKNETISTSTSQTPPQTPFESSDNAMNCRLSDMAHRNEEIWKACHYEWTDEYDDFMPKIPHQEVKVENDDKSSLSAIGTTDDEDNLSTREVHETEVEQVPLEEEDLGQCDVGNRSMPLSSIYRINYFTEEDEYDDSSPTDDTKRPETASSNSTNVLPHSPGKLLSKQSTSVQCQFDDFLEDLDIACHSPSKCTAPLTRSHAVEEEFRKVWEQIMEPEEEDQLYSSYRDRCNARFASSLFSSNPQSAASLAWILSPLRSPFLCALLSKLRAMPHNTLFVNLIVTDLLLEISCYPHFVVHLPLLLFNAPPQFSSLKKDAFSYDKSLSLFSVLQELSVRIQAYGERVSRFPHYLLMARRYLDSRTSILACSINSLVSGDSKVNSSSDGEVPTASSTVNSEDVSSMIPSKEGDKKYSKLFDSVRSAVIGSRIKQFFQMLPAGVSHSCNDNVPSITSSTNSHHAMSSSWTQIGGDYRFCIASEDLRLPSGHERLLSRSHESLYSAHHSPGSVSQPLCNETLDVERCAYESQRIRNYAYATMVYHEFCLELESLCNTHAELLLDATM